MRRIVPSPHLPFLQAEKVVAAFGHFVTAMAGCLHQAPDCLIASKIAWHGYYAGSGRLVSSRLPPKATFLHSRAVGNTVMVRPLCPESEQQPRLLARPNRHLTYSLLSQTRPARGAVCKTLGGGTAFRRLAAIDRLSLEVTGPNWSALGCARRDELEVAFLSAAKFDGRTGLDVHREDVST